MVWLDTRSIEEAGEIETQVGQQTFCRDTGMPTLSPSPAVSTLLWLVKHQLALFDQARLAFVCRRM